MNLCKKFTLLLILLITPVFSVFGFQRDQIKIVGSSTALPFTSLIAENFGRSTKYRTPIVEANGTGDGIHQFCRGVGPFYPDIAAASRPIKLSEKNECQKNFVSDILEIKLGYDGVIIGQSKTAYPLNLSLDQLRESLAEYIFEDQQMIKNQYDYWNRLSTRFPKHKIKIFGPPPSSGTREILEEQVLIKACKTPEDFSKDAQYYCRRIREDGRYVDLSTNENLIINKIIQAPNTVGIFGYSFYKENRDHVRAIQINGVKPTYKNISSQKYPITRTIYLYVKKQHLGKIKGLSNFIEEVIDEATIGDNGYLIPKGFIALPEDKRKQMRIEAKNALSKNE